MSIYVPSCDYDGKSFEDRFVMNVNIWWHGLAQYALKKYNTYTDFKQSQLYQETYDYCVHHRRNGASYAYNQLNRVVLPYFERQEEKREQAEREVEFKALCVAVNAKFNAIVEEMSISDMEEFIAQHHAKEAKKEEERKAYMAAFYKRQEELAEKARLERIQSLEKELESLRNPPVEV